jgi:hypothetical protein
LFLKIHFFFYNFAARNFLKKSRNNMENKLLKIEFLFMFINFLILIYSFKNFRLKIKNKVFFSKKFMKLIDILSNFYKNFNNIKKINYYI